MRSVFGPSPVVHAAESDADELAVEGAGDGAPERGLSNTWRSDEAEDGALHVTAQFADREELDEPLLDLVEAVVVLVEDAAGVCDIEVVGGRLSAILPIFDVVDLADCVSAPGESALAVVSDGDRFAHR